MDANLATTYTLIHSFLRKHSHTKAALAVKKAAKDIVVLKDDIEIEGPCLDTILMEWKTAQAVATKASSSDSSHSSDSEDSSDSSDSDSSDLSDSSDASSTSKTSTTKSNLAKGKGSKLAKADEQVKTTVVPKAASSLGESSSESSDSDSPSSSSSDSDSESSDSDVKMANSKPTQKLIKTTPGLKPKVERQSSQTLTSGSSSSSSASEDTSDRETLKTKTVDNNDSSDSESSSSDSENDASVRSKCVKKVTSTPTKEVKSKATKPKETKKPSSSSSSSSDSDPSTDEDKLEIVKLGKKHTTSSGGDETPAQATKKRRTTEDGAAVVTATTESVEPPQSGFHSSGRIKANGKPARKTNTPFQRVNPEKVDQQVLLQNNGYMAKAAPANDYGARAHQDLIVTRGAGFRKEKNKKKRGSYKGGTISLESHSFKFT
ncbi:Nucleolar and coiled-body phosphoprotein 1 [Termitomyces sp. T112]|nr:Nucleolar and coiled-body phosphoprotein 1 [Termitomyces sp. T112]